MKIFPNKYPFNIPHVMAGFIGGFAAIFGLTAIVAEKRPSSTSSIAILFILAIAGGIALIAYVAGTYVRTIVSKSIASRTISRGVNLIINLFFMGVLFLAFISGILFSEGQEEKQKPRILFNSGEVATLSLKDIQAKKERDATFVFSIYTDDKDKAVPFQWNGRRLDFKVLDDNTLKVLDKEGNDLITANLKKFDYIGRIYVLQFALDDSQTKGLAVLIQLRATSRRSMLLIYDSARKLIYKELLERRGDSEMSIMNDPDGKEYLYVNVDKPTIYSIKTNKEKT